MNWGDPGHNIETWGRGASEGQSTPLLRGLLEVTFTTVVNAWFPVKKAFNVIVMDGNMNCDRLAVVGGFARQSCPMLDPEGPAQ